MHIADVLLRIVALCFPFAIQNVGCVHLLQQERPSKRALSKDLDLKKVRMLSAC